MANKIAFNPQDRFVVTIGNQLIVTTKNGDVFGHDLTGRDIGPAFAFTGAKAAFNPGDRFVVTIGNQLIVTTQNGDTFGHEVSGRNIGPAFKFTGAKAAFNPGDRFVVTIGNQLIVITQNGDAFGHEVSGRNIGPHAPLNPDTVVTLDSGPVTSGLSIGGNARLVMSRTGDTTFSGHMHNSGGLGIKYLLTLIALTPSGLAYTSQHSGDTAGTFTSGSRDDDWTQTSFNDKIRDDWNEASRAKLSWRLHANDTLTPQFGKALEEALQEALKQAGQAAVKAAIALF
jgi:hypothetical protein